MDEEISMDEGANKIFNEESNYDLKNLLEAMSDIKNIEHERTLHACYSEYFHQKVVEFENVDKQIELLSQLFITKSNDLPSTSNDSSAIEITEERNVTVRNIRTSFDFIKTEGFGLENLMYESSMQTVQSYETTESNTYNADIQMNLKSGDNFSDFVLKDFDKNCDNETEMIGYGTATPGDSNQPYNDLIYLKSNMPPRKRFKGRFLMTLEAEPEVKRKREIHINNNE